MEVEAGSRQTDVGTIPADWDARELSEIFSISAGGDLVTESFSSVRDEEHCYPIYCNALSDMGVYGYSKQHRYDGESVTVTARGTIGVAHRRVGKFDAIGRLLVMRPTVELSCGFVSDYLNQRVEFAIESTGVPQLTAPRIARYKIAFPPFSEQTAIAAALSDADSLILGLEKLIAKERDIKKGAMQMLLTGKKRLPGFSGDWTVRKLANIAEIRKGQAMTGRNVAAGDVPVIAGGIAPSYYHDTPNRKANTITISASGANAGYVSFHTKPIFASDCSTVEENIYYDIKYLFYLLQLWQRNISKLQTGGAQPHVYPAQLRTFELGVTQDKAEQTTIAQVLSDIDAEIETLEKKLSKYRLIKQGMMQELLTGRKRLI